MTLQWYDSYGNKLMADYDNTYVEPVPPEPNAE